MLYAIFPAEKQNKPQLLFDIAAGSLRKSPVSSSPGDEVPHIFIRKPRLRLGKISISTAKSLLQQYRHGGNSGHGADSPFRLRLTSF
jgi:hypothetical protein